MKANASESPGLDTQKVTSDTLEFICSPDFAYAENEDMDACIDDEIGLYVRDRQVILDVLLDSEHFLNNHPNLINFIDDKIVYLNQSFHEGGHAPFILNSILVFLFEYREKLSDYLHNLNTPEEILSQQEEVMDEYFDECLGKFFKAILSVREIVALRRGIKSNSNGFSSAIDRLSTDAKKADFYELCCLINPSSSRFAIAFGEYALRSGNRKKLEEALFHLSIFPHRSASSAQAYGELALSLEDRKYKNLALKANRPYLSESENASVFARLARDLEDRGEMRSALKALKPHLDQFGNASTYGSLACIIKNQPDMKHALQCLLPRYVLARNSTNEGNLVHLHEFFIVSNTCMILANNINEKGSVHQSLQIAKEVRMIFQGLGSRAQKRFSYNLKALDHSESVAHVRDENYSRAIALLTNDDDTPKYKDEHRMSTLRAAKRGLRAQYREVERPPKKRKRHRFRRSRRI